MQMIIGLVLKPQKFWSQLKKKKFLLLRNETPAMVAEREKASGQTYP